MVGGALGMITRTDVEQIINTYYVENSVNEMMGLLEHVTTIAPTAVLEVGVCFGGSLKLWEKVIPEGGIAIGVDANPSIELQITGQRRGTRGEPSDWVVERRFTSHDVEVLKLQSARDIYVVISDSKSPNASAAVADLLGDQKIDFWFHDGCHYGVGPVYDYANFEDLIRTGALVCVADVDDVNNRIDNLGTQALWHAFPGHKVGRVNGHAQGMALWWKTEDFRMAPEDEVEKNDLEGDDTTEEGRRLVWLRQNPNSPEAIIAREGLDDTKPNGPKHGR
jgi:hypothetical protein